MLGVAQLLAQRLKRDRVRCNRHRHSAAAAQIGRRPLRRCRRAFRRLSRARALNCSRSPAGFGHADDRHVQMAPFDHGLQCGKDLLVGQIARGSEEHQGVGSRECNLVLIAHGILWVQLMPGRLFHVAAELKAHGRQQLVGEVGLAARRESFVERRGEHRRRHGLVDGGLDRPAAFARIGHPPGEFAEGSDPRARRSPSDPAATTQSRCRAAKLRQCRRRFKSY